MNTALGTALWALGGLAGAVFALPFRKVKGWKYESYWLVYALFGLVLFPWALAFATVPDLFGVLSKAPAKILAMCAAFGALWGIGGLSWGLMIRYLGVGLGLAIGCGLCSATGTLIPPIVKGQAASLVADQAAITTLVGVFVSLLGIVFVGLAGKTKEDELPEEAKKASVAEFNFKKGIIVALVAGIASAGMNFGLQGGEWTGADGMKESLAGLAVEAGARPVWAGMPVLVVVLFGGFVVNLLWCLQQNAKNKSFGDYATLAKPATMGVVFWSGLAGVIWACQFACQKMGESFAGDIAYISFAIVMGSSVLFSSLVGIFLGEWKGTSGKTKGYLAAGLAILASSIGIAVLAKAGEKPQTDIVAVAKTATVDDVLDAAQGADPADRPIFKLDTEALEAKAEKAKKAVADSMKSLGEKASETKKSMGEGWKNFEEKAGEKAKAAKESISKDFEALKEGASEAMEKIGESFKKETSAAE